MTSFVNRTEAFILQVQSRAAHSMVLKVLWTHSFYEFFAPLECRLINLASTRIAIYFIDSAQRAK